MSNSYQRLDMIGHIFITPTMLQCFYLFSDTSNLRSLQATDLKFAEYIDIRLSMQNSRMIGRVV